jgi:hypothetical protein
MEKGKIIQSFEDLTVWQLASRVNLMEVAQAQRIVADAKLLSGKLGNYIKVRRTSFK